MRSVLDHIEVWSVTIGAIYVSYQSVHKTVTIVAPIVAIVFTTWKFYVEYTDRQEKKKQDIKRPNI